MPNFLSLAGALSQFPAQTRSQRPVFTNTRDRKWVDGMHEAGLRLDW